VGELINPLDILFHVINLVILYFVLKKLLYKPVAKFMEARRERFAAERAEIDAARKEIDDIKARSEEIIAQAHERAKEYERQQIEAANRKAEQIIQEAKAQAEKMLQEMRLEMQNKERLARESIKKQVVVSAVDIAAYILQRKITEEDQAQLLDEFLTKVG